MSLHPFYQFLVKQIEENLPGREAQLKMSPVPLDPNFVLPRDPSESAHPSGVLIPLFPDKNEQLNVILTLRTKSIRHAGQISFPGGRREDNDESLRQTALRETKEEIGVDESLITLAGHISPLYLYRTDNQITPFVGFLQARPELTPNPVEVEEIITIPIPDLLSDSYRKREKWELPYATFDVPYWSFHNVPLWGATAMMMSELLELYRDFIRG